MTCVRQSQLIQKRRSKDAKCGALTYGNASGIAATEVDSVTVQTVNASAAGVAEAAEGVSCNQIAVDVPGQRLGASYQSASRLIRAFCDMRHHRAGNGDLRVTRFGTTSDA